MPRTRDNVVGVVNLYGLQLFGVRIPGRARDFLLSVPVETDTGARPASCVVFFPGDKAAGA